MPRTPDDPVTHQKRFALDVFAPSATIQVARSTLAFACCSTGSSSLVDNLRPWLWIPRRHLRRAARKCRCQMAFTTPYTQQASLHSPSWRSVPPHSSSGIDDAALMSHLHTILEDRLTDAVRAIVRRLAFEAQALALQDLKNKFERTTDSAPKVLPLHEKLERIRDQQSRYQECVQDKSQASLKFRSDGSLRITQESPELTCDVSSAHLLRMASQRRALAYDAAHFHVQEKWNQSLFDRMSCPTLPGFSAFSLDQLLVADRALWLKLSEQTRGLIKQLDSAGAKVGDVVFATLANDPKVNCLPLPNVLGGRSAPLTGIPKAMASRLKGALALSHQKDKIRARPSRISNPRASRSRKAPRSSSVIRLSLNVYV